MRQRMSSSTNSGQRSRLSEFLSGVPMVTLIIMAICIIVYIADNLGDCYKNLMLFSISPYMVLYRGEVYRIITAAFCHGGLMHIGMNMMSLYQLGGGLEPLFGSLQYTFILLVFTIATGTIYVCMAWLISLFSEKYIFSSAVGFSGVLFAMAVDEASLSPAPYRSVFGLFQVPTRLYPWVLMILLQIMLPNVSFLGHLAGIIVGMLHTVNAFRWLIPSLAAMRKIEQMACMRALVRSGPYKLVPATEVLREGTSVRQQLATAFSCLATLFKPIFDCVRGLISNRRGGQPIPEGNNNANSRQPASSASAPRIPERPAAAPTATAFPDTVQDETSAPLTDEERKQRAARMAAAATARLAGVKSPPSTPKTSGASATAQPTSSTSAPVAAASNGAGHVANSSVGRNGYAKVPQDE